MTSSSHALLDNATHRDLTVATGAGAQWGDGVMGCLVVPAEFRAVAAHYPIVFRRDPETGRFAPLALFGFEQAENLFLADDHWDAAYVPLAHAVQPFLIGRTAHADDVPQVHIDLAHARVGIAEGQRLFDETGAPTPYLAAKAEQLGALDAGWRATPAFLAALETHDLLEPFALEVPLAEGSTRSLVGYHIIAEERLAALDGAALGALNAQGHLLPIYMAVAALGRFADLLARRSNA
ncbi:hypothetical protein FHT19_000263 [Novosphingobium sp. SG919]|nr:hypothetical protein [Novosphingobium sp. SG919]